jgi:hypothetical protein
MSDREYCKHCKHAEAFNYVVTCTVPTPFWADSPPVIIDVNKAVTCNTFELKLVKEVSDDKRFSHNGERHGIIHSGY